jgi:hypothetical protein
MTHTVAPETDTPPQPEAVAASRCSACGHDWLAALRDLIGERHDAWGVGVLEGYAAGWRDGLTAGAERSAA